MNGSRSMDPLSLYTATMRNGAKLAVMARSLTEAEDRAFSQYHIATGKWEGVWAVQKAEGYDVA